MDLKLIDDSGESTASVPASDALFAREYNEALVHQLVTAYMANARSGTRKQKARSDVGHSHHKPWRQKGTGRARAGFSGSPLWRGGARIFPNLPEENFKHKVNRKMYRAGICAILSQLAREGRLLVVEDMKIDEVKTKTLAQKLKAMGLTDVMIITERFHDKLYLSARNLPNVLVVEAGKADPVSLVRYSKVLLTRGAVQRMEQVLA
jgi:large subunit ribosomal protein L4